MTGELRKLAARLVRNGIGFQVLKRTGRPGKIQSISLECRDCTEPGLERVSLPREGFAYLSLLFRLGSRNFMELHRHLGLEKYC